MGYKNVMANSKPLLSVIVPIYNVQDYVAAALQSLQEQSFTDFEAILVEDKSTDDSLAVIQEFAHEDPRFYIIQHKTNQGVAAARNVGLENAQGEYIYYFDPDDLLPHDFLKNMMVAIQKTDIDIVCANTSNFAWDTEPEWRQETTVTAQEVIDRDELLQRLLPYKIETTAWSYITRRKFIGDVRFSTGRLFEDEDYTAQLFTKARRACLLHMAPLGYCHRVDRPGSIIDQNRSGKTLQGFEDLQYMLERKYQTCYVVMGENPQLLMWYYRLVYRLLKEYRWLLKNMPEERTALLAKLRWSYRKVEPSLSLRDRLTCLVLKLRYFTI